MSCDEARILLVAYAMRDLEAPVQYRDVKSHLDSCPLCAREYQMHKETIRYLDAHVSELAQAFAALERGRSGNKHVTVRLMTCPTWAQWKTGGYAIAASLILAVLGWLAYDILPRPVLQKGAPIVPMQVEKMPLSFMDGSSADIRIVLYEPGGAMSISPGKRITSGEVQKEVIINDTHRIMVNAGTSLRIQPLVDRARIGCLVTLDAGEILAKVEQDGNPFVVDTAHGIVTIVGTVFDVKVTEVDTALMVAKGKVRFEGNIGGSVDVLAGQVSRVKMGTVPSEPVTCDPIARTAWARRFKVEGTSTDVKVLSRGDLLEELPWLEVFSEDASDLQGIDYEDWIRGKRLWFQRQFPGVFRLRKALVADGIEVSYPDLLLQSKAIWAFSYRPVAPQRLPLIDDDVVVRAANHYGMNRAWLKQQGVLDMSDVHDVRPRVGIEAFASWGQEWIDVLDTNDWVDEQTLLASAHASVYILNTRTLAWMHVEKEQCTSVGMPRARFQSCLECEIQAAHRCLQCVIRLLMADDVEVRCQEYKYRELVESASRAIGDILLSEKEFDDALETVQN